MKTFNFLIIHEGRAIFWCSAPSHFGKAAQVVSMLTRTVIKDIEILIESQLKVRVESIVADNENANKGLFQALREWRPSLLCLGCNAHGLQLVLSDVFNVPVVAQAMRAVDRVLRVFERNKNLEEVQLRSQVRRATHCVSFTGVPPVGVRKSLP